MLGYLITLYVRVGKLCKVFLGVLGYEVMERS